MKNFLAALLLVPCLVFADPVLDMKPPVKNFMTTKDLNGFMVNLEVPMDARELSLLKIKNVTYTFHVTKKIDFALQAMLKIDDIQGLQDFKFINFGSSYKLTDDFIIGASITSLSGSFDQTSKFLVSMKYVY